MAPLLFRGLKGVSISCASPASTATCTGMDPRRSVVRRSDARAIDGPPCTPHLRAGDCRKTRALNWAPPPSPSKLKLHAQKGRKSTEMISPAASSRYLLDGDDYADDAFFFDVFPDVEPLPVLIPVNSSRFRSAGGDDSPALRPTPNISSGCSSSGAAAGASSAMVRRRLVHFGDESSSSSSSPAARFRYDDESPVLGSSASTKYREQLRAAAAAALPDSAGTRIPGKGDGSGSSATTRSPGPSAPGRSQSQAFLRSSSVLSETRFEAPKGTAVLKPSSSARTRDQVVVLRVSLHCRGCEAKVRKHLSRMEGVTSFSIDFATKKVTVSGDVTPLGVLSAISKVKNAQFWPLSPPRSSASS